MYNEIQMILLKPTRILPLSKCFGNRAYHVHYIMVLNRLCDMDQQLQNQKVMLLAVMYVCSRSEPIMSL